jgi:DNA-binding PadR family transcriptional regulator
MVTYIAERTSEGTLEVELGSFCPGLHRLGDRGWVSLHWCASENSRNAEFYWSTAAGSRRRVTKTTRWRQMNRAIASVMGNETVGGAK